MPANEKQPDKGHDLLIKDLSQLLRRAEARDYHDFDTKLAAPKMELYNTFLALAGRVKEGVYDNTTGEATPHV